MNLLNYLDERFANDNARKAFFADLRQSLGNARGYFAAVVKTEGMGKIDRRDHVNKGISNLIDAFHKIDERNKELGLKSGKLKIMSERIVKRRGMMK